MTKRKQGYQKQNTSEYTSFLRTLGYPPNGHYRHRNILTFSTIFRKRINVDISTVFILRRKSIENRRRFDSKFRRARWVPKASSEDSRF